MVVSHGKSLKSFDQGQKPSLLLDFARRKSLIDQVSKSNLITFTRATAATYIGADGLIKTAAVNEARFDHDPPTGESLGLLIEEQRTNLVSRSEGLDLWDRDGLHTSISTGHTAPDGSTNSWLLDKYTSATSIGIALFVPLSNSGTYVHSWFLKAGTAAETIVSIYDSTTGSSKWAVYSWAGGVPSVSSVTSEAEAFDPVYYGDGWWRVSVKVLNLNSANPNSSYLYTAGIGAATGTVYAWGAQLEEGEFPTSYIPTAGAAATRNTDEAYITGTNFSSWYNQSEGSLFAQYQRPVDFDPVFANYANVVQFNGDDPYGERIEITSIVYNTFDFEYLNVVTGGQNYPTEFSPAAGAGQQVKICYAIDSEKISASRDGSVASSSPVPKIPSLTSMRIGIFVPQIFAHNGTIKRIIYWPTRLDDSDLQEATR